MATQIYLGMPPPKIKEWIEKNYKPAEPDMLKTPLHFTANNPGEGATISLECEGYHWCEFEYSIDGMKTWKEYNIEYVIQLDDCENKTVYFQAKHGNIDGNPNLNGFSREYETEYYCFDMKGSIKADGNIQYLLANDGTKLDVPEYCYFSMFSYCTSLTQAPKLPATTLDTGCYRDMFYGCTSLTQAPELPSTTLDSNCYDGMFYYCTSLTKAFFPNLEKEAVVTNVLRPNPFQEAADNIEVVCKDGILIVNSTEA